MSHLLREHAPITEAGWDLLDSEARERLTPALAARKLVDFDGPAGVGALGDEPGAHRGCRGCSREGRRGAPAPRSRAGRAAGAVLDRPLGARRRRPRRRDVDLDPLDEAARRIAGAENAAVFHGWRPPALPGSSRLRRMSRSRSARTASAIRVTWPRPSMRCWARDRRAYGLALGPDAHTRVLETSEHGGYPLLEHLREIVGGPIVWAPAVKGGAVLSMRGGDFLFECGQDLSIGYESHDADAVHLYLEESFSFHVATPEAAVALEP